MRTQRQKLGKLGEDLAVKFLRKKGYQILERNFYVSRFGEIDIIARREKRLIFVEVKTKRNLSFGSPEEEFTPAKKKKIWRAIQNYLLKKAAQNKPWQVDLIAIDISQPGKAILRHYKNLPIV